MPHVKLLSSVADMARQGCDRWYVTNGDTAVGPVKLDLIARGVAAERVPLDAFVRHEDWRVWCPLSDIVEVIAGESLAASRLDQPTGNASLSPKETHSPPGDVARAAVRRSPRDLRKRRMRRWLRGRPIRCNERARF